MTLNKTQGASSCDCVRELGSRESRAAGRQHHSAHCWATHYRTSGLALSLLQSALSSDTAADSKKVQLSRGCKRVLRRGGWVGGGVLGGRGGGAKRGPLLPSCTCRTCQE